MSLLSTTDLIALFMRLYVIHLQRFPRMAPWISSSEGEDYCVRKIQPALFARSGNNRIGALDFQSMLLHRVIVAST